MVPQAVHGGMGDFQVSPLKRASTICLVRQTDRLEVLMVRRPLTAWFMPGVWVFPGGKVDEQDSEAPESFGGNDRDSDWKVAALRELIEETGLWLTTEGTLSRRVAGDVFEGVESSGRVLDQESLIYISNWITPNPLPLRFDTRFFLAVTDADAEASVDGDELIDVKWIAPLEALRRDETGEWALAFPTRMVLHMLATGTSATALAEEFRTLDIVPPIQPRLAVANGEVTILLPGEPGFDDAEQSGEDSEVLSQLVEIAARGGDVPAEFRTGQ